MGVSTSQEEIERAYRDHGVQLWRGIYAFSGGRRDIADDAVAEAFARALESSERIRSPLPWLYRVAIRKAAERLRAERRALPNAVEPNAVEPDAAEDANASPSLAALALLTPQQRVVVFLFYYADLSVTDIARTTGTSRVAVRVQLSRARKTLRRRYGSAAAMRAWASTGGSDERELV
jgi:RNA polymerase sigma-70 factor (ECF subfamily)